MRSAEFASESSAFREALLLALPEGVPAPDDAQLALMEAWYAAVVEANQRFNLTRITAPAEAAVKHFADSLAVLAWADVTRPGSAGMNPAGRHALSGPAEGRGAELTVLDIGTGAGFPAAPVAIMRPLWRVTAIDSTGKKARFVAETAGRLGIANLGAKQARAEQWRPESLFDLVLFKAVGSIADCLAACRHLVREGGCIVHYKTPGLSAEEEAAGREAAARFGLIELPPHDYQLRFSQELLGRTLRVYRW